MVGQYARNPGTFSPLVEEMQSPAYTPLEGAGEVPAWDAATNYAP